MRIPPQRAFGKVSVGVGRIRLFGKQTLSSFFAGHSVGESSCWCQYE
ncbi:hypothetical protein RKLH11_2952 [Rhodobacteraceae bacterium KLH11]|nr:hypothetical protein RKLH11_2952 [Rhodobacteraceae bacterium KLH11]